MRHRFRLFRQPDRIGDTFEHKGVLYLVLGIERYELLGDMITIWYIVQDLSRTDYVSNAKAYAQGSSSQFEFVARDKYDSEKLRRLQLGRLHEHEGTIYKIQEYTEIQFVGTDMKLSFLSRPIHPIDRKEARAKLFSERRKKLKLEVF